MMGRTSLLACGLFILAATCFIPSTNALRTNFCPQALAVANGSLSIKEALRGLQPTVAIYPGSIATYLQVNPTTMRPNSGFLYQILERVAADGGFLWNYEITPNPSVPDDIYLANITQDYDIVAKVSFDTSIRRQAGVDFTPPLVDASIVLITDKNTAVLPPQTDWLVFMSPFTWDLVGAQRELVESFGTDHGELNHGLQWLAIVILIVVHALAQIYIDLVEIKRDKLVKDPNPTYPTLEQYFYVSFATFHWRRHESAKRSGRALYIIFVFMLFIITAAYGGNLTSALILQNANIVKIANIDDANRLRASICFRVGSASINLVKSVYPNINPVITVNNSNYEVLEMLAAGKCDAAVLAYNDWQIVGQSTVNAKCNLVLTGPVIRQMTISVPFRSDFSTYCTSLFGNVLSGLIQNLTDNFVIQSTWSNIVDNNRQVDCTTLKLSTNLSNAQLNFTFFQGLFIVFAICTGGILLLHTIASAFDFRAIGVKLIPSIFGRKTPAELEAIQKNLYQSFSVRHDDGTDHKLLNFDPVELDMSARSIAPTAIRVKDDHDPVRDARQRFEDAYQELMAAMAVKDMK